MLTNEQVGRLIGNWARAKTDENTTADEDQILDIAKTCVKSFVGWLDKEGFCISSIFTRLDYEQQMAEHFGPLPRGGHHRDAGEPREAWVESHSDSEDNDDDQKGETDES